MVNTSFWNRWILFWLAVIRLQTQPILPVSFYPPPEKFEAGLQDYAGIMGLGAAVKYLQGIGFETIQKQESLLNEYVTNEIKDIPGAQDHWPC